MAPPPWIQRYVNFLHRRGWAAVLLFWVCVVGAGILGVVKTFENLKLKIEPIPGDANDLALRALSAHFPAVASRELTLVELRTADGSDVRLSSAARAAADRIGRFAAPYIASGLLASDSGAPLLACCSEPLPFVMTRRTPLIALRLCTRFLPRLLQAPAISTSPTRASPPSPPRSSPPPRAPPAPPLSPSCSSRPRATQ